MASIALNVLKPSLVRPNLSRSQIDMDSLPLNDVWNDVASHIRQIVGPCSASVESSVKALAAAIRFAGIPEASLSHLVPPVDWPVWMLRPESGLSWHTASTVLEADEILEAPNELRYVLGGDQYFDTALRHVKSWQGPVCFVALEPQPNGAWWSAAASLAPILLKMQGFAPSGLRFVNGASDDEVPLVCRVWRKRPNPERTFSDFDPARFLADWRKDRTMMCPELVEWILSSRMRGREEAPELFRFPAPMSEVAGIGSLYWNQNNPKIQALIELLLELSRRLRRGGLSGRALQVFEHVNSTAYLGYVVPSRHSSTRAAIGRYSELVRVAKEEGISMPRALEKEDFWPGSVGKYWNPYHYPIRSWSESKRPVGVNWG